MTQDELRRLLPNASASFLARNTSAGCPRPAPVVEPNPGNGTLGKVKVQKRTGPRFLVRVESVRKRLLDPDNLAEKFHVDLCRYAGAIPGDTAGEIEVKTTQRKSRKGEAEHTLIVIEELL